MAERKLQLLDDRVHVMLVVDQLDNGLDLGKVGGQRSIALAHLVLEMLELHLD